MSLHRILALALCLLLPTFASANVAPVPPNLAANAWLLIEVSSGQTLAAEKADQRLEPASLTKLMTAYLSFAALRDNTLKLTQALPVSEKAGALAVRKCSSKSIRKSPSMTCSRA